MIGVKKYMYIVFIFLSNYCFSSSGSEDELLKVAVILATGDNHTNTAKEKVCVIEGLLRDAVEEGMPISYTFYDNDRTVIKSGEAAKSIVEDKADIVIAPLLSGEALAAVNVLEHEKIPTIVTGTTPKLTQNRVYSIGILANDQLQAKALAAHTLSLNPSHIKIVVDVSREYSIFIANEFRKGLKEVENNITVSIEEIYKDYPFFSQLAEKIIVDNPDLIFTPLYVPSNAQLYVALRDRGNTSTMLGSDSVGGRKEFYNIIGGEISNKFDYYFVKNSNGKFDGPESKEFHKVYKKYCLPKGIKPSFLGGISFDSTRLLLNVIKANGVKRDIELIEVIRGEPYSGVLGMINFNQLDVNRLLYLYKIGNGNNDFVKSL